VWVWDLVLDNANGPSSLAASLSTVAGLLEGWVDAAATNEVRWGTRSALVMVLSHFPELEDELELLGSGPDAVLMKDRVDALWILARLALDLLASYILHSVTHSPPDGLGEKKRW
jgi:hypothetical protein